MICITFILTISRIQYQEMVGSIRVWVKNMTKMRALVKERQKLPATTIVTRRSFRCFLRSDNFWIDSTWKSHLNQGNLTEIKIRERYQWSSSSTHCMIVVEDPDRCLCLKIFKLVNTSLLSRWLSNMPSIINTCRISYRCSNTLWARYSLTNNIHINTNDSKSRPGARSLLRNIV